MILNYVDKKIKEDLLKELCECKTSKEMDEVFDKFDDYLNRLMFANKYEDIFLLKIHILNNFMNEPTINYSPYDKITPKIVYELTKNTFLKERKKDKLKNNPVRSVSCLFEFEKNVDITSEEFSSESIEPLVKSLLKNYKKDKKMNILVNISLTYNE